MPFAVTNIVDMLAVTSDIGSAEANIHLSPEKSTAGTIASKGVDRNNARHPGSVYHPLLVTVNIDGADTDDVTISMDHGNGSAFDYVIAVGAIGSEGDGPATATEVIFDLDGNWPGLLIFPRGSRTAPDSLLINIPAEASRTASTTILFQVLEG